MNQEAKEVTLGRRFEFGKNWQHLVGMLNEERINQAQKSLQNMLELKDLTGMRVLDIGSGSGLFSLAARRLGAKVHSFDCDKQAVICTAELKRRYFFNDAYWTIEEGSVLHEGYLKTLGQFEIVYAWGVLHHTGEMWKALENVAALVAPGGGVVYFYLQLSRKAQLLLDHDQANL